jgi:hypothetical protein
MWSFKDITSVLIILIYLNMIHVSFCVMSHISDHINHWAVSFFNDKKHCLTRWECTRTLCVFSEKLVPHNLMLFKFSISFD